eukprot:scpid48756/ scgid29299/ Zinc finger BED domain-containing protein 4
MSKTKVGKLASQRSFVWEHFSQPVESKVICSHCKRSYSYTGGTTNLQNHLRNSHPFVLSKPAASSSVTTEQGTRPILAFGVRQSRTPCNAAEVSQISNLLVDWICLNMRPLGIVGDGGFVRLMSFLKPGFTVPSRTCVAGMIQKRHAKARKELVELLQDAPALALTTDAWTSKATMSYLTFTVHFVAADWTLRSYVLETTYFQEGHTANNLAAETNRVVESFGISTSSVKCIVHDEARNVMAASRLLKRELAWDFIACAAHRLQTCIRHAVAGTRQVEKLLADARRLVSHFHHSSKQTEALNERQVAISSNGGKALHLIQDVATRWNSGHAMLVRLLELKLAVMAVLQEDSAHKSLLLKDHQWTLAQEVVDTLGPAATATTLLGGERYCTMSLLLPIVSSLHRAWQRESDADDATLAISSFRARLVEELEDKFSIAAIDALSLPSLSSAIDPRSLLLGYLDSDEDKAAVKLELKRMASSIADLSSMSDDIGEGTEFNRFTMFACQTTLTHVLVEIVHLDISRS